MTPLLKAPGIKCSNLKYGTLLSSFAFNFNLRRYIKGFILSRYGNYGPPPGHCYDQAGFRV